VGDEESVFWLFSLLLLFSVRVSCFCGTWLASEKNCTALKKEKKKVRTILVLAVNKKVKVHVKEIE